MIHCIVVDDEPIARIGMKRLIARHPDLEADAYLESADEAAAWLAAHKVDLVFLDIRMPGRSGMDLARAIPADTMVIFTTAFSEYAVESYEIYAVDYLLKPIDAGRFDRAVARAAEMLRLLGSATPEAGNPVYDRGVLTVKADRRYFRIKAEDILYIEGLKDYVVIHTPARRIVTRMKVKDLDGLLPTDQFLRVSRSYIVNRNAIDSFDTNDIMIGDTEIAIGATYRDSVLASLL